jgi:hypothetical protein
MVDAYATAHTFVQLAPGMPMPSIHNGQAVGPVALLGRDRRVELRRRFALDADNIIALLALGAPRQSYRLHTGRAYSRSGQANRGIRV